MDTKFLLGFCRWCCYDTKVILCKKPVKRRNAWRIQVRYKNLRDTATRDTARECEQWAAIRLLEMKAEYDPQKSIERKAYFSFHALFQKYYDEVGCKKRGRSYIQQQLKIKTFKKYFGDLAEKSIYDIEAIDVRNWRDKRLQEVAAGTVHRHVSLYIGL